MKGPKGCLQRGSGLERRKVIMLVIPKRNAAGKEGKTRWFSGEIP